MILGLYTRKACLPPIADQLYGPPSCMGVYSQTQKSCESRVAPHTAPPSSKREPSKNTITPQTGHVRT
ncbi:hypothetical protein SAICODRAFT_28535 [Saitoella complicata NRRL Y-17804]|uniref:uncharacterized protein n=1 Tax=Saitoella complicata (strain BCRC 22490 / CBS 7301 / JCM 7358 / NBRC 10748 / NRRL Y-17804) TaxID=698492 RepID=UPI00086769C2|nr:uncharacterized protein SAICODRAFT_28535 [Saitoella complicata NRRL Y-17804]ODQ56325.1 hypothetical protein SAICODRAFT_28535 [Saitoella complicata NRRL Y-17804]